MAVTINPGALTTLATMKEILGISLADTSKDTRLNLAINAATAAIEGFCGRVFSRASITDERHRANGGARLAVNRPPINSLTSIEFEGDLVAAIDEDNYTIEKPNGGVIYVRTGLPSWSMRRAGTTQDAQPGTEPPFLLVTYDGGFVTAQQAEVDGAYEGEAVTLPGDLETACIRYAVDLYNATPLGSSEVESETLGDASVTYRNDDDAIGDESEAPTLPPKIARMVKRYRRIAIV